MDVRRIPKEVPIQQTSETDQTNQSQPQAIDAGKAGLTELIVPPCTRCEPSTGIAC